MALAVVAALLHGVAYILYNVQTKLGQSKPNIASWSIWTFLAILNALTFKEVSKDFVSSLQFATGSVACSVTFFYVLSIGKFKWPTPHELRLFGLGALATAVWLVLRNSGVASLIITVAFLISFVPTWEGVWRNATTEKPLAWILWTTALTISAVNIFLRGSAHPIAVFGVVSLLIAHGAVAILSRSSRQRRYLTQRTFPS